MTRVDHLLGHYLLLISGISHAVVSCCCPELHVLDRLPVCASQHSCGSSFSIYVLMDLLDFV